MIRTDEKERLYEKLKNKLFKRLRKRTKRSFHTSGQEAFILFDTGCFDVHHDPKTGDIELVCNELGEKRLREYLERTA